MRTWFIADTHFGHEGVLTFGERPFGSVESMDETLIANWNLTVAPTDVVYHIGDVGFHKWRESQWSIIRSLNGRLILVRGNHDPSVRWCYRWGFDVVVDYAEVVVEGGRMALSHRPLRLLPSSCKGVIHGHIHLGRPNDLLKAHSENPERELIHIPAFNVNVCVEKTEYRPMSTSAVRRRLRKQLRMERIVP